MLTEDRARLDIYSEESTINFYAKISRMDIEGHKVMT